MASHRLQGESLVGSSRQSSNTLTWPQRLTADSSFDGHWFQCFVDSVLIPSGQLTAELGQSATGQKQLLSAQLALHPAKTHDELRCRGHTRSYVATMLSTATLRFSSTSSSGWPICTCTIAPSTGSESDWPAETAWSRNSSSKTHAISFLC